LQAAQGGNDTQFHRLLRTRPAKHG
jgi:hypothetical protein